MIFKLLYAWILVYFSRCEASCSQQENAKMKTTWWKTWGERKERERGCLEMLRYWNQHAYIGMLYWNRAWGHAAWEKKKDCLLKDLKVIENRASRRVKEGQSRRHVKAEITGYPYIISVCAYLGCLAPYLLLSPSLLKITETLKQSPCGF